MHPSRTAKASPGGPPSGVAWRQPGACSSSRTKRWPVATSASATLVPTRTAPIPPSIAGDPAVEGSAHGRPVAAASETAPVPPRTTTVRGARRASSSRTGSGAHDGGTRRSGAPRTPAAAPPAKASGKAAPVATNARSRAPGKARLDTAAAVA